MLGVGLGMVLHLSVNMVVSTINLPLKKKFSCLYACSGWGGGGIYVMDIMFKNNFLCAVYLR